MACPRCSGFTVFVQLTDYKSSQNPTVTMEKCVSCGSLNDPVCEQNRKLINPLVNSSQQAILPKKETVNNY